VLLGIWSLEAATVLNVLYVMFLIAIGQGVARGINFECGCFTQGGHGTAASVNTILRDLWFLAMSLWLLWAEKRQTTWNLIRDLQHPDKML